MKYLSDVVELQDTFKRSININLDMNDIDTIRQFYCPMSFEILLETMVRHIQETGQSAFTWTGAYGTGKSSLALFLTALAGKKPDFKEIATAKLRTDSSQKIKDFFQANAKTWDVLTITGNTESPEALFKREIGLGDQANTDKILAEIQQRSQVGAGILIFVDEMGKIFDGIAKNSEPDDIYFFQRIAEVANRSEGRIILIGILHQSFIEYARNLGKKTRDEWNKIQGRFVDLAVNISTDEQIYLISQTMVKSPSTNLESLQTNKQASSVVANISRSRKVDVNALTSLLANTWPLHPVTTILLCEQSKKRYGQNQRSIFSFLMSAEPNGFRDYLRRTKIEDFKTFSPNLLWDYLETNLDSLLSISSESKQWLIAKEAIARYATHENSLFVDILKTIAICNLLKGSSGLSIDKTLLGSLFTKEDIDKVLDSLTKSSVIAFRKYLNGYALTDGSDFDIETALEAAYNKIQGKGFEKLREVADFKPILAKRHYHLTGALRWMSIELLQVNELTESLIKNIATNQSLIGAFIILVPADKSQYDLALKLIVGKQYPSNILLNIASNHLILSEYVAELLALEWIDANDIRVVNDHVARKEVQNRISFTKSLIENELHRTINSSEWLFENTFIKLSKEEFSGITSKIADNKFNNSPCITNEMLNRDKPSSNANAALNALLKKMVLNRHEKDLGITGFPPEMGLYRSILHKNNLHVETEAGFVFTRPQATNDLPNQGLVSLWNETDSFLLNAGEIITADKIYEKWQQEPYGIKKGLLPVLLISYMLSNLNNIACYLDDQYQTDIDDLLIDYLIKAPKMIGLLSVVDAQTDQKWIGLLAKKLNQTSELDKGSFVSDQPLSVARALVYIVDRVQKWTHRTKRFNRFTLQLRDFIRMADDPNKLLFESIPSLFKKDLTDEQKVDLIISSIQELTSAFPDLMQNLQNEMFKDLNINYDEDKKYDIIKSRANSILGKSGDFKTDAFISRLSTFSGNPEEMAAIVSLLTDKPTNDWIDQDIERASQKLSIMCDNFNRAEIFAKIEDANSGRYRIGLVTKGASKTSSRFLNADVFEHEETLVENKFTKLSKEIADLNNERLRIAVLAKLIENLGEQSEQN